MKMRVTLLMACLAGMLLTACSSQQKYRTNPIDDASVTTINEGGAPSSTGTPDTRFGIFVNYSTYHIKVRSKPFISILDEIFYQKRFNYTISDDVPDAFINIREGKGNSFKDWENSRQMKFTSLNHLLQYLLSEVNNEKADGTEIPRCSPHLCSGDVIDAVRLGRDVLHGHDIVSVALSKKHRDILEVITHYSMRDELHKEKLKTLLRDTSSREFKVFKQLLPDFDGIFSEKVTIEKSFGLVAIESQKRLVDDINTFIRSEGIDEFNTHLAPFVSPTDLVAIQNYKNYDPETRRIFSETLKRKCIEKIYAGRIALSNRYKFRYLTDGVEFYREKDMFSSNNPVVFKKIFLFNLTTDEAKARIGDLFDSKGKSDTSTTRISAFPAQNALMISANRSDAENIGQHIFSLDSDFNTVLVETKIFEYDDSLDDKLGAAISFSKQLGSKDKIDVSTLFAEGILATSMPVFAYGFTDADKKFNIMTQLAANTRDGAVRITAEPRLAMKPGEESTIKIVTNKKVFTTPSSTGPGDLKDVTATTSLEITPTILSDKKILLNLTLQQMEFIPNSEPNVALVTNTNSIKSRIIVNDGELLSIGGLKTRKQSKFFSGIPYLKDIPYLGVLFGSKSEGSTIVNIEFMIRPTIKYTAEQNRRQLKNVIATDDAVIKTLDRVPDATNLELHQAIEYKPGN